MRPGKQGRDARQARPVWTALELPALVELIGISALAVAQPVFSLLRHNTELLLVNGASGETAMVFTVLVALAVPVAAWIVELGVGAAYPPARAWVHAAFLGAGVGAVVLRLLDEHPLHGVLVVGAIALAAAVAAYLFHRFRALREWLRFLSVAAVAFSFLFVTSAPVRAAAFDQMTTGAAKVAAKVAVKHPAPVTMIVFDEFALTSMLDGTGHIDAQLFPNFAALAGESTWYRNTTTVAPYTWEAVPAIDTGRLVPNGGVPTPARFARSIFTLLGGTYSMNVVEPVGRICPESVCPTPRSQAQAGGLTGLIGDTSTLFGRSLWSTGTPSLPTVAGTQNGPVEARDAMERFIADLGSGSRTFNYLHVLLPHVSWNLLPDLRSYDAPAPEGYLFSDWAPEAFPAETARVRSLLQVQAADTLLGRTIARMKALGTWDKSLFVVTADHGVNVQAGRQGRATTPENYPNILWTPTFIKKPHQASGTIDNRPLESIDIVPTMADILGVKVPWKLDGRSALGPARPDGPRPIAPGPTDPVQPLPGKSFITWDGPSGFQRVLASRTVPPSTGDPELGPYRNGPHPELIGTPLAAHLGSPSPIQAAFDHPERYRNVAPEADNPPVYVSGKAAPSSAGTPLVITVNGVVAAYTSPTVTLASRGATTFFANIPPQLLRAGTDKLGLAQIVESGSGPDATVTLHPLKVHAP